MKNKYLFLTIIFSLFVTQMIFAQSSKKRADKDTFEWRYEIEVFGQGVQGTYQVKVWSYSKKTETAVEQAKKNAVHGVVFKGFPSKGQLEGKSALATSPNVEQEKEDFFKDFFATGGKYLKYVTVANNGAFGMGDVIKIDKEYKVGVVISVNVAMLRKDLEDAGIIKGLSNGF
ncbi:MAG: hypothetical protein ACI9L6_001332 [Flavobacterium sp.]|jgi:hypothetical protein